MSTIIANFTGTPWSSRIICNDYGGDGPTKTAQSFTPITGTWVLTSALIRAGRALVGLPSAEAGDVTMEVRSSSPAGTVLDSITTSRLDIPLGASNVTFTFAGGTKLHGGTVYYLVMSDSAGQYYPSERDFTTWSFGGSNFYAGGSAWYYIAGEWTENYGSNFDNIGYVFGDAFLLPSKPINPTPENGATGQRLNIASFLWEAG